MKKSKVRACLCHLNVYILVKGLYSLFNPTYRLITAGKWLDAETGPMS